MKSFTRPFFLPAGAGGFALRIRSVHPFFVATREGSPFVLGTFLLALEQPEVPRFFGLSEAGDRRLDTPQKLGRRGEHRRTNANGDSARPMPYTRSCDPFDPVDELEGSTQSWWELNGCFFHRRLERYRVSRGQQATSRPHRLL